MLGIMKRNAGFAGQPGYVVHAGERVILTAATNLPADSRIDYFAVPVDGDDYAIGIGADDVTLIADYNDIELSVEDDDCHTEAPWDDCDGYEHDIESAEYTDQLKSVGCVNAYGWTSARIVRIDDDTVINKWGITRRAGEAKQVWLERVAAVKRTAIERIVGWYEDGWSYYLAGATYGDCSHYCGGIDCEDYAEEVARELRDEVVHELESNGYIVENKPGTIIRDDRKIHIEQKLRQMRYNLTGCW